MMKKYVIAIVIVIIILISILFSFKFLKKEDKVQTKEKKTTGVTTMVDKEEKGDIMDGITLNYHASIKIEKNNKIIYFDPYKIESNKNDANYVFITHSHYDHYSEEDIKKVMNDTTKFIVTSDLEDKVSKLGVKKDNLTVVYPNEKYSLDELKFETIPSYNINSTYHKKSYNWVGYNVEIDGFKYYVVGDSDVTNELKATKCDVIFVPVGGTYTMTAKEATQAVNEMKPKAAVPVHYGVVGSKMDAEDFVKELSVGIKGVVLK